MDIQPIPSDSYYKGTKARELDNQEIVRGLAIEVIEPGRMEWASPVIFVSKKDGTLRFCIDYCKLKKVTKQDSYSVPGMDE